MDLLKELESLDVNVQEGLDRVMGDEDLYKMMLDMFITTIESTPIRPEDFDGSNLDELIGRIHALKGTTGNLSLPLFARYTETLNLLRENKPAEAKKIYAKLLPKQEQIVSCIQRCKNA